MTDISKRLEQFVNSTQRKLLNDQVLPIKVAGGILVGNALIVSEGSIKHIWQNNDLKYKHIYLNAVAINIANILATRRSIIKADELYRADQEYGKWFNDSQMLRTRYQKAVDSQDHDRADILWARYCESRDRALLAKNHVESLTAT
jgi:hypothetical protein